MKKINELDLPNYFFGYQVIGFESLKILSIFIKKSDLLLESVSYQVSSLI